MKKIGNWAKVGRLEISCWSLGLVAGFAPLKEFRHLSRLDEIRLTGFRYLGIFQDRRFNGT